MVVCDAESPTMTVKAIGWIVSNGRHKVLASAEVTWKLQLTQVSRIRLQ